MSRFREKLLAGYAAHYQRGNASSVDPRALSQRKRHANDEMFGELVDRLAPGASVLDLGCGTGLLLAWLSSRPGLQVFGVDASAGQVATANACLPHVAVECSDGLKYLEEHEGAFDAIFCFDVLEHVEREVLLDWVEAARRALKPGGFFLCRVPNAANLTASYVRYIDLTHERCFTVGSLIQLLEAGGFRDLRPVPIRTGHLGGAVRLALESALHRAVFRVCGRGLERVFTNNVMVVGFRANEASAEV